MKLLVLLACVAMATAASLSFESQWEAFKIKHDKGYGEKEEYARRLIFQDNLKTIVRHNQEADAGKHSYWLGVNQFADMTHAEYLDQVIGGCLINGNRTKAGSRAIYRSTPNMQVRDTVDWRDEGLVTDIKDQGQCGSCWAFSTTGSLEGQHAKATGTLVSLSEQNLVDCSRQLGNKGCEGGDMDQAFQYIIQNNGIDQEQCYPYKAKNHRCKFDASCVGATMSSFTDVTSGDEDALKQACSSVGPISVGIDASHQSFQLYNSGVYDEFECSSTRLDHGVLVVGYGTYQNKDYWLVKNSWGTVWGNEGYIMMSRNKENQCGVATDASFPVV
ncbi:CTSV [Branchiostoma lanceolatum]|uniref:CTSV protein n=1 Tax=Branchiostoma lanceolatum TaxID=7740 RepID=A0A8J9YPH7_BRALA|nr:CTSV [Branchiostoma lanceolatum]